jgi:hypothetical protein
MRKKTFYQQVLKLGANEASAQGLQNAGVFLYYIVDGVMGI